MRVCVRCAKSRRCNEHYEKDSKTGKTWSITSCASCGYNFDIEERIPSNYPAHNSPAPNPNSNEETPHKNIRRSLFR